MTADDHVTRVDVSLPTASRVRDVLAAYVGLTKPRIIELLLVTTVPAMFLAAGGVPPLRLVLLTMVGGCLAAASANAFNCVLDRDIDERMRRTRRRPLPRHIVDPRAAALFETGPRGGSDALFNGLFVNWLSGRSRAGRERLLHRGLHGLAGSGVPRRTSSGAKSPAASRR